MLLSCTLKGDVFSENNALAAKVSCYEDNFPAKIKPAHNASICFLELCKDVERIFREGPCAACSCSKVRVMARCLGIRFLLRCSVACVKSCRCADRAQISIKCVLIIPDLTETKDECLDDFTLHRIFLLHPLRLTGRFCRPTNNSEKVLSLLYGGKWGFAYSL